MDLSKFISIANDLVNAKIKVAQRWLVTNSEVTANDMMTAVDNKIQPKYYPSLYRRMNTKELLKYTNSLPKVRDEIAAFKCHSPILVNLRPEQAIDLVKAKVIKTIGLYFNIENTSVIHYS